MKTKSGLTCLVGLLLLVSSANAAIRTWTRNNGTQFDAEYVRKDDKAVTLRDANGTMFSVNIAALSNGDRAFIGKQPRIAPLPALAPPAPAGKPAARPMGPVISTTVFQRDKSHNVVSVHTEFDFPTTKRHLAIDLTPDFIRSPLSKQYLSLDAKYHFTKDEAREVKAVLVNDKAALYYTHKTVPDGLPEKSSPPDADGAFWSL